MAEPKKKKRRVLKLKKIILSPLDRGVQRATCQDDRIDSSKTYLTKTHGAWRVGRFSKQWYGWNFNCGWGGAGIQLDMIRGPLYELIEEVKEVK